MKRQSPRLRECPFDDYVLKLPLMVWARLTEEHPRPYRTAQEIVDRGCAELLKVKNIGRKKLIVIRDALKEVGLTLEIPAELEPKVTTEREARLRMIRKVNAAVRQRARQRGI